MGRRRPLARNRQRVARVRRTPGRPPRNSTDIRNLAKQIVDRSANSQTSPSRTRSCRFGSITAGRENSNPGPSNKPLHKGADPVAPHNGQFRYDAEDARIAGAGIDFVFTRTYKNQGLPAGDGANWKHAYNHG